MNKNKRIKKVNPAHIRQLDKQIEKLNYDEDYYEDDYYMGQENINEREYYTGRGGQEGKDWVWGMEGVQGGLYDMNEASQYDKDFFRGRPVRLKLMRRMFKRRAASQMPTIPAALIRPGAGLPPASSSPRTVLPNKPQNRPATEAELTSSDQFDIKVVKTIIGAGIAADLPFILFSPVYRRTNYVTLLPLTDLPAGTTVAVNDSGNGNITFTYVNGVDSVILTVSSDTTPYRSMLEALITDRFNVVKTRDSISDLTTLSQVNLPLSVSNGSLFGGQSFNKLSAVATKSPDQFQNGIIDFNSLYPLDKFRAVQGFMSQTAPDQFSTSFSFWAKHVIKN